MSKFELGTFTHDDSPIKSVEVGLPFDEAVKKAKKLWESGDHYGVAVIDQTPNATDSIQWLMSKSEFIENIPLADEE